MHEINRHLTVNLLKHRNRFLAKGPIFPPPGIIENRNALHLRTQSSEDLLVAFREDSKDIELVRINRRNDFEQALFAAEKQGC